MRNYLLFLGLLVFMNFPALAETADFSLESTDRGIRFRSVNQPLDKVLEKLTEQSGIVFQLNEELNDTPITARIQAPDWKSLVTRLLEDFSKIEFWVDPVKGSKIRIIGLGEYEPPVSTVLPGFEDIKPPPVLKKPNPPAPGLAILSQKRRPSPLSPETLPPEHPLSRLPPHVLESPVILDYLHQNGVDIPEELQQKYGINDETRRSKIQEGYSIPSRIYNDPALEEFLSEMGLPKPPQFSNNLE